MSHERNTGFGYIVAGEVLWHSVIWKRVSKDSVIWMVSKQKCVS